MSAEVITLEAETLEARDPNDPPECDTGAPVVLITGQPGAGKTLYAIAEFAVGKSKVFQRGIPGCTLPKCDPTSWATPTDLDHRDAWTVPEPGTTWLVDEAREVYPPKSATQEPPDYYQLHKIRHTGCAIVILAQHPNDIDARVRRLVGRHIHVIDNFGTNECVIHEWNHVHDPDQRQDSVSKRWKHPKAVYRLYRSSAQHRKQPAVPLRLRAVKYLWMAVAVCVVAGPAWLYFSLTGGPKDKGRGGMESLVASPGGLRSALSSSGDKKPAMTTAEYVASFTPRVADLPHTAPRYDEVTKVAHAPRPAACVSMKGECRCYTQQATRMVVSEAACLQIVERGWFQEWEEESTRSEVAAGRPGGVFV